MKINHLAVWCLVVFHQALGFFWYAKFMFLNPWLAGRGITLEQMNSSLEGDMDPTPFIYGIISSILTCYLIAWLVGKLGYKSWKEGSVFGLVLFAAMVFPAMAPHYKFLAIADSVLWIDLGMSLVATVVTSTVLTVWQKKEDVG